MAFFKINEPNKEPKWIEKIDSANGTLTFTENREKAHYEDEGFFADSELEYLKFHFTERYPELMYMTIDSCWASNEDEDEAEIEAPVGYDVGVPVV